MSAFNWLGTVNGNLGNHLNYLGSPAGVPGSGDGLVIDDTAVGFSQIPTSNTGSPVTALASLSIVDSNGDDFSGLFNNVAISGLITQNGVGGNIIGSSAGGIAGSGNGPITITTKTGDGTINGQASPLTITNLGTSKIAVGASAPDATNLVVSAASSGSRITFTSASQGTAPGVTLGTAASLVTEIVANKTSGACAVDLNASTINADATLTSQLNGVTVTDGTGGTFSNLVKQRASGQNNTEATVTGGVEQAHALNSTIGGTYNRALGTPTAVYDASVDGNFDNFLASNGTWTATVSSGVADLIGAGNNSLHLLFGTTSNDLALDTITVTAASTGPSTAAKQQQQQIAAIEEF